MGICFVARHKSKPQREVVTARGSKTVCVRSFVKGDIPYFGGGDVALMLKV